MTEAYKELANGIVMWLACAPGVLIVLYQAYLFFRRSIRDSERIGISKT